MPWLLELSFGEEANGIGIRLAEFGGGDRKRALHAVERTGRGAGSQGIGGFHEDGGNL